MIPSKLRIKGLYSYRGLVEIDFDRLVEAHLFGIFGPVGSGKSAILEAITYVLYGNTERLGSSGRNYNMMNLQSQEMLIEFEFRTADAEGENRYRFRVQLRRNSKQFSDVKTPVRSAARWENGVWIPLESTNAESVLKLSYENFTKTVIVPQGKFQEFLHMDPTARTQMLRELFSLDRFELDRPTNALIAETKEKLVRLEEQLRVLEGATPEEIAEKENRGQALQAAMAAEKEELRRMEVAVAAMRQLKERAERVAAAKQHLQRLESQKAEYEVRGARAQRYQKLLLDFKDPVQQEARLEGEVQAARRARDQAAQDLATLTVQLALATEEARAARQAWEARGEYETQLRDCGHLLALRKDAAQLAAIGERLLKGEEVLGEVAKKMQHTEETQAEREAAIARNRAMMPDLGRIWEVQLWYQEMDHLRKEQEAIAARLSSAQGEIGKLSAELDSILRRQGIAAPPGQAALEEL
ncbi:MAG: hypothetical protein RLZZ165_4, partial [Bacteroidota bacterium]